jgi:hypothetical protein
VNKKKRSKVRVERMEMVTFKFSDIEFGWCGWNNRFVTENGIIIYKNDPRFLTPFGRSRSRGKMKNFQMANFYYGRFYIFSPPK